MAKTDQRFDGELKRQQGRLDENHDAETRLYFDMLADGDAAYEALKMQARIDRALSELAGGPASSFATLKARGESALRNEIGDTERQHERFADNVEHALAGLAREKDAAEVITENMNIAQRNAMELNQRKFDAELGLQKQYHELNKKNSVFDQMYKLYTSRRIGKDTFKEKTGIEVKAMPRPRRMVVKKDIIPVGKDWKGTPPKGYKMRGSYDKNTKEWTFYMVKDTYLKTLEDNDVSLYDNNHIIKHPGRLYAELNIDGFKEADPATQFRLLQSKDNKDAFVNEFGKGYYNLFSAHLTSLDGVGRYYSSEDKAAMDRAFNNILQAATNGGDTKSTFDAYNAAIETAGKHLYNQYSDSVSWRMVQQAFPEIAAYIKYSDSEEDKKRADLGIEPEGFTSEELIKAIMANTVDLTGNPIKGTEKRTVIKDAVPYLNKLDEVSLLAVWAYVESVSDPDDSDVKNMTERELIDTGEQIFEKIRDVKNEAIIAAAEKIGDEYDSQDAIDLKKELKKQDKEWDKLPISTRAKFAQEKLDNFEAQDLTTYYLNFNFDAAQNQINKLNEYINAYDEKIAKQMLEMSKYNSLDEKYKEAQDLKIAYENQQSGYENEIAALRSQISTAETTQYTQEILGAPDYAKLVDLGRGKGFTLVNDAMHSGPENVVAFVEYLNSDAWEEELYINPDGDLRSFAENQKLKYEKYTYMTDDEKGVYYYLYAKEGKKGADDYLARIEESLNLRQGITMAKDMEGKPLEQIFYGLGSGLVRFGDGIRQLFSSDRLPASAVEFASQAIYEDLGNGGDGKSFGQVMYDISSGVGYMAPTILLTAVTAGAGAPAAAASGIGAGVMGLSAKGNAYNWALGQGYTKEQAGTYSTLIGVSEGVLQYALGGISKLGGKLTSNIAKTAIQNIDKAVLRIAAEMPIRMGGEFAEEYLQAVLEPAFRNMAFNEHNEIILFSPDNFYQGMIGAFTAGLLEGGPAVARNISNTQIGHGVIQSGKYQELIDNALALDTRTEAFKIASKLANGSVHMNNYNAGELLQAYVEADGDTAFMSMPNTEAIANTQQAVRTTLEQEKAKTPDAGMASGVAAMTSSQIGQSIQEGIRRNAAINPEGMQKTLSDGMSALIAIETRIRAESSNINHPRIGIDSVHDAYMDYLRGEMALDTIAWSMAETISTVMQTQTLSEAETSRLTAVLAEIVGDVGLAQAYLVDNGSGKAKVDVLIFNEEKQSSIDKLTGNIKIKNAFPKKADDINTWWKEEKGYEQPPYLSGSVVLEFELNQTKRFVRVYDEVHSYMRGQWFMYAEDIEGLTPKQIQEKYALPNEPKYIVDLIIPEGVTIRAGEANALFGFGGKGIQLDLMGQRIGEWANPKVLN